MISSRDHVSAVTRPIPGEYDRLFMCHSTEVCVTSSIRHPLTEGTLLKRKYAFSDAAQFADAHTVHRDFGPPLLESADLRLQ